MLSISLGLMKSSSETGYPSTTYSGDVLAVREFTPLTRIFTPIPGAPFDWRTSTPATRPTSACPTVAVDF